MGSGGSGWEVLGWTLLDRTTNPIAVLDGGIATDSDPDVLHAETILRGRGLPAADAAEVAGRPLPGRGSD